MDHNSASMFGDGDPISNKQASAPAPTGDLLGSDFGSSHDEFDMTSTSLPAAEVGEARKFLDDLMDDAIKSVPTAAGKADVSAAVDPFGFEKPLPPEPKLADAMSDFLKSEQRHDSPLLGADEDDERRSPSPMYSRDSDSPSPVPPPVPKHQTPPPAYEPSHTPEPELLPPPSPKPQVVPTSAPSAPPVVSAQPPSATPPPVKKTPAPSAPPQILDIGTRDIRNKLLESLIYWRDPKKSGIVFGVTLLSLLSLTCFSLISVFAWLCLFIVGGSLSFRIYKSIMQAVQKTSDGHPFKDYLELDLTVPEDKVTAAAQMVAKYLNTSLTTLRSLFLVEDIIDSIKFLVLCWVLTYVGSCFNGLTLIIIGVVLLFALPKVYENNKAQIDVYIQIAMEKLSIVTNKVKAAVPGSKKEEKKDQ